MGSVVGKLSERKGRLIYLSKTVHAAGVNGRLTMDLALPQDYSPVTRVQHLEDRWHSFG